jgi:hypothetical protein
VRLQGLVDRSVVNRPGQVDGEPLGELAVRAHGRARCRVRGWSGIWKRGSQRTITPWSPMPTATATSSKPIPKVWVAQKHWACGLFYRNALPGAHAI